eukprot:14055623-Alexandrium_andersonii.AAC.1
MEVDDPETPKVLKRPAGCLKKPSSARGTEAEGEDTTAKSDGEKSEVRQATYVQAQVWHNTLSEDVPPFAPLDMSGNDAD